MIDVETIFDSDREEYEFMQEKKEQPMNETELKPCPFCGGEVELHGGPENWTPTFYDPDSGGDPYYIQCKCGCFFDNGCYYAEDLINAWNRRATDEQ